MPIQHSSTDKPTTQRDHASPASDESWAPPVHTAPPPGLAAWLASVDGKAEPSIREIDIDGVACVVKRRRPGIARGASYAVRYLRAAGLAVGCRVLLGEFPSPRALVDNGLDHEARRLRQLDQSDWRVPHIWWHEPGVMVLENVGLDMPGVLRRADAATRLHLADLIGRELAAFHRRGLWHGGAQVRNLTWREEAIWRIDFEENIGGTLSLPIAQAYDVYQCLSSIVALRNVDGVQASALGDTLLRAYLDGQPDEAVRRSLRRMARHLRRACSILRPLFGRIHGRDVQGFFRAEQTLGLLLRP